MMAEHQVLSSGGGGGDGGGGGGLRAEIDTSAPFESVKEAVSRFGEQGFWKPNAHNAKPSEFLPSSNLEEMDIAKVEEQAAALEKELILKEKDTLEVLKELEATKMIVEELKSKLQTEESAMQQQLNNIKPNTASTTTNKASLAKEQKEEEEEKENLPENLISIPSSSPGLILMELRQAKANLSHKTRDLAEIRASVELYNKKIEKELISLEKTRERLKSNSSKVSSLEEELARTKLKLEEAAANKESPRGCDDVSNDNNNDNITAELHRLSAEAEEYKKMGEAAKSEVLRAKVEIEQTTAKIKTAEVRLVAARKMKEAARAAEAVALAEINALEKSNDNPAKNNNNDDNISLSVDEYSCLRSRAQDAEESCHAKVLQASVQVEEANASKEDIMKKVEETLEEVKTSKKVLEEALRRVEAANGAKLAVEEALRRWRSEHGERRRSAVQNSTKFKNPCPSIKRRDSSQQMLDVNGINLVNDDSSGAAPLKPPLSIGQILSRKLLVIEEYESGKSNAKRKVSLGQMLGKQNNGELSNAWKMEKEGNTNNNGSSTKKLPVKSRKKFGFARISVLLSSKESKKKKKPTSTSARY